MNTPGYIYVMRLHVSDHWPDCPFKIGQSVNPEIRRSQLGIVMPYELSIVKWIKTNDMDWAEAIWHDTLHGYRMQGEWFSLSEFQMVHLLRTHEMINSIYHDFWTNDGRFVRADNPEWMRIYSEMVGDDNLPF